MKTCSLLLTVLVPLLFSCSGRSEKESEVLDTPTSGSITIAADATLRPLIEEELNAYHGLYPATDIHADFLEESSVSEALMARRIPVAFLARKMDDAETVHFTQEQIPVQQIRFATDAIALITHPANRITGLTYEQLIQVLSGKISRWNELSAEYPADSIILVFDQRKSSTTRFIQEEVLRSATLTSRAYALDSVAAVREYVRQQRGAIGLIGVSWINDRDQQELQQFMKGINVVGLSNPDSLRQDLFYTPTRVNILYGRYPLRRDVYAIITEGRLGLGTGFANFILNEQGQLIVHHFGLVAAKQPVRVIELKKEF